MPAAGGVRSSPRRNIPHYTKKMFRIERLSADERQRIIDKDKKQYLDWLQR